MDNKHGFELKMSSNALLAYSMNGLESLNHFGGPVRPAFISDESWAFFQEIACDSATHVIIARLRSKRDVIGWFRFTFEVKPSRYICAQGTWVDEKYRKLGIAMSLWELAIKEKSPSEISVVTTSKGGLELITKLKLRHPKVLFLHR